MVADGLLTDAKPLGNLRVAQSFCHQRQRLALALGERGEGGSAPFLSQAGL